MDKKIIGYGVFVAAVLVAAIGGLWHVDQQAAPKRDAHASLARCLGEREVIFYGAFWCPACAQQKAMFGDAMKKLPYTECSLPNKAQNDLCTEAEITNYPVWEFNGDYRCGGVTSPEVLAHVAGCPLPAYDGIDNTPSGLYERLVVTASSESLQKRGISADRIREFITTTTEDIDAYLTENHGTTVATVEDSGHLLTAIAEALHNCAPYEKQEAEVSEDEGIDIELVPEGAGDQADGGE